VPAIVLENAFQHDFGHDRQAALAHGLQQPAFPSSREQLSFVPYLFDGAIGPHI
jgi:hypothetical protein